MRKKILVWVLIFVGGLFVGVKFHRLSTCGGCQELIVEIELQTAFINSLCSGINEFMDEWDRASD